MVGFVYGGVKLRSFFYGTMIFAAKVLKSSLFHAADTPHSVIYH
jgi:hypothetical protein